MTEEEIARINELARKSKGEGLTEAEKEEQKQLRQEFIRDIRENLRGQLETITIVEPDGSLTPVRKKNGK
jgi:uncharacterized protein YnzC (UPF0291/DUF896 family)